MSEGALVFVVQAVYVVLLGLQSLNVNGGHRVLAAATSFALGVSGFYVTSVVGSAKGGEGSFLWWCFVLSGPVGILAAMSLHPRLVRLFKGRK